MQQKEAPADLGRDALRAQSGHLAHSRVISAADAVELAETLQLIARWLAADPAALAPSLLTFIGHPAYGPDTYALT